MRRVFSVHHAFKFLLQFLYLQSDHQVLVNCFWRERIHHRDDVIKCKYFPRYWPFVRGIHRSPVNSPHKGQWCGALMFSLICAWISGWVNNGNNGDSRRHPTHYAVTVMILFGIVWPRPTTYTRYVMLNICDVRLSPVCNRDDVMTWKTFHITGLLSRESTADRRFQRPVIRCFEILFVVCPNKLSNEHSTCRWLETSWCSYYVTVIKIIFI